MVDTVIFKVDGMSCTGCSSKLEKALNAVPGVSSAEVTLDPGQANIYYDGNAVQPAALRDVVEDLGFDVVV